MERIHTGTSTSQCTLLYSVCAEISASNECVYRKLFEIKEYHSGGDGGGGDGGRQMEWAKTSELDDSRILPCESGRILLCFLFLDFDVYRCESLKSLTESA